MAQVPGVPELRAAARVEEMMFLVLQIGVIIFAARVGGAIACAS